MATTSYCELENAGIMAVAGRDAGKFLQGYMTCDADKCTEEAFVHGAFCNLQGRMVTSFHLANDGEVFYLRMARPLVAATKAFLGKYLPLFKATCDDASDRYRCFGVYGEGAAEAMVACFGGVPGSGQRLPLDDGSMLRHDVEPPLYEVWVEQEAAPTILSSLSGVGEPADEEAWQLQLIRLGLPTVTAAISEQFVPQMMNLQLVNGVDFDKGCYLGQEVVARMEYRGNQKRNMYRGHVDTTRRPADGDALVDGAGAKVGTIVAAAGVETGYDVLAVLTGEEPCKLESGEPVDFDEIEYPAPAV